MPSTLWSQDVFTKGELSPLMYARTSVNSYYNGVKLGKNTIGYPQGAIGKRFGTIFQSEITGITEYEELFFKEFQYLNECVYLLAFNPSNGGEIDIFLEGLLIATVTGTGFDKREIRSIDFTVIETYFRVCTEDEPPKQLQREADSANRITGFTGTPTNTLTITSGITANRVFPATFTATVPATTPAIKTDKTYFVYSASTTTIEIYTTPQDAKARANKYVIADFGTTSDLLIQNTWTFPDVDFAERIPFYDFTGGYDTYYFSVATVDGSGVVLSCWDDAAKTNPQIIFFGVGGTSPSHIGGAFIANGGAARIASVAAGAPAVATCTIDILVPFTNVKTIAGNLCILGEQAWSIPRGFPTKCSSYENRAVFANSTSLPNGIWLSSINGYEDFNDLEDDDDNAISWFPTSDDINYIKFIVPYRSLTVHTNSGVYSSPLGSVLAITPKNFSLSLQDSTPATEIQPRPIDNQIIIVSGDDVHSLLWDGINNAYTSNIISLLSEHLIVSPHDEAPFRLIDKAGSRYMFLVNDDGTLPIYQTVIEEEIGGWTHAEVEQDYGTSNYRWTAASNNGRAWFVVERQIALADTPVVITAFAAAPTNTLTATGVTFSTTVATACKFATGTMPTTIPQLVTGRYYWAVGVDANDFKVYVAHADATAGTNEIEIVSAGSSAEVEPWTLNTKFLLEELSFDVTTDCSYQYDSTAVSTLVATANDDLTRFNGQAVQIQGDGFGFSATGEGEEIDVAAHGLPVTVSDAHVGFAIDVSIELMPISIAMSQSQKTTNIVNPKKIRSATFMFTDLVGGTVNDVPIIIKNFDQVSVGVAPVPATGIFKMSLMKGWDDFNQVSFTINHNAPFDMKLLGVFYKVDV